MSYRRVILRDVTWPNAEQPAPWRLDDTTAHYLTRVLRVGAGESVEVCNGRHESWLAALDIQAPDDVWLRWLKPLPASATLFPVLLLQGMPKSDKLESILQKGTEVGVSGYLPFFSSRCIVRPRPEKLPKRMARWRRIVEEAARQCQRTDIPTVHEPVTLEELASQIPEDYARLVCWEEETSLSLKQWMAEQTHVSGVAVAVGPEGGFSTDEVDALSQGGFRSVGLGPLILRTETAGPTVGALFQFAYGPLGEAVSSERVGNLPPASEVPTGGKE